MSAKNHQHINRLSGFAAAILAFSAISVPNAFAAVGPTVSWTSPADQSTVSGITTIQATAAPDSSGTARIIKWCLTMNGNHVTSDIAPNDPANDVYTYGVFSSSTGCWTVGSAYGAVSMDSGAFNIDTTTMTNGPLTFQLTVTDTSNRTATSTVRTLNVFYAGPSVSWTQVPDGVVSGSLSLAASALADPVGNFALNKWCLTVNGNPIQYDATTAAAASALQSQSTFDPVSGCWTSSIGDSLTGADFRIDTSKFSTTGLTLRLTVTDVKGRVGTSTTTVSVSNSDLTVSGIRFGKSSKLLGDTAVLTTSVTVPDGQDAIKSGYWQSERGEKKYVSTSTAYWSADYSTKLSTWNLPAGRHTIAFHAIDLHGKTFAVSTSFTLYWAVRAQVDKSVGARTLTVGSNAKVTGHLTSRGKTLAAKRAVVITWKRYGKSWSRLATIHTASNGSFAYTLPRMYTTTVIDVTLPAQNGSPADSVSRTFKVTPKIDIYWTNTIHPGDVLVVTVVARNGFKGSCSLNRSYFSTERNGTYVYPNGYHFHLSGSHSVSLNTPSEAGWWTISVDCSAPGVQPFSFYGYKTANW